MFGQRTIFSTVEADSHMLSPATKCRSLLSCGLPQQTKLLPLFTQNVLNDLDRCFHSWCQRIIGLHEIEYSLSRGNVHLGVDGKTWWVIQDTRV
jgi:hypothetical protein